MKPISNEQVQQFRTEGYLAIPDFWSSREVEAMQRELARLQAEGALHNVATDGDGSTHSQVKANLQLCPLWPHSELFRAMPWAPQVAPNVSALLGGPVCLHLDQVFLKPAGHGAGTNWHQDNAYFNIDDPLRGTALWTAVHAATAENGTIRIIPAVFRQKLDHSRDPESDHHIRCYPEESKAITIELPAGGAVFFAYGTPHSTGANHTDKDRAGVALHFLNEAVAEAQGGFTQEKRPSLNGPESSGGLAEYGVRVANTWPAEVGRVLS